MSFKDFISNFVIIELGKSVTLTSNISCLRQNNQLLLIVNIQKKNY